MKKLIIMLALIIGLVGCNNKETVKDENTFNIVTSFYPIYLLTQNVIADVEDINIKNLTLNSSTGCLHGYNLTTANMKDIEAADVFIINGANMEESFLEDIKKAYPNLPIIDTSIGVEVVKNTFSDEDNSHIWLSVENAEKQVENIKDGLIKVDSENAAIYVQNADNYILELNSLEKDIENKYDYNVVAMHDSLYYFAENFGLNIIDIVQNDEEDVPSPKRLQEIIRNIKENNVKAIFTEEHYSEKLVNMLSDETGVEVYIFDSITSGDGKPEEYISRMRGNIEVLEQIGNN